MPTTYFTDSGISTRTNVYAEKKMLEYAMPVMVLEKLAVTKPMPKNKTSTIKFRRPIPFTAATVPLVEGVTPQSSAFSYEDVQVSLKQYGMVVEITDVIDDLHEDPVLNDASIQAGENVGRTIEALNFGIVNAGTNVFYANGGARNAVNTPITLAKQRAVIRGLKANKAQPLTQVLSGSPNYSTRPVEAAYVAVTHTDMEADLRNLPNFTPVAEYGNRQTVSDQEIGMVENVRYVLSPDLGPFTDAGGARAGSGTSMVSTSGTSADVYPIMYFGKEAFGMVALRGQGAIEPSIIPVGQKTKDDPLGQRGYVGWKTYHGALILNQLWLARLEVAVSTL